MRKFASAPRGRSSCGRAGDLKLRPVPGASAGRGAAAGAPAAADSDSSGVGPAAPLSESTASTAPGRRRAVTRCAKSAHAVAVASSGLACTTGTSAFACTCALVHSRRRGRAMPGTELGHRFPNRILEPEPTRTPGFLADARADVPVLRPGEPTTSGHSPRRREVRSSARGTQLAGPRRAASSTSPVAISKAVPGSGTTSSERPTEAPSAPINTPSSPLAPPTKAIRSSVCSS